MWGRPQNARAVADTVLAHCDIAATGMLLTDLAVAAVQCGVATGWAIGVAVI